MRRTGTRDIAIIGMACIFPKAPDVAAYWRNILHKVCALTEATPEHWDTSLYYDPEGTAPDRVACKQGGFLTEPERSFRPLDYGIMPKSVHGGEPDHFLALRVAYEALSDAGYLENAAARSRTAIILGKGNYINAGNMSLIQHGWVVEQTLKILRRLHPEYPEDTLEEIKRQLKASLPPFNTEVIPSLIPNLMTGRIANRLDIHGPNYTVDAACASSLLAVDIAVRELAGGRCDLALVGGVQGGNTLLSYLLFSPLKALSRSGAVRAFDSKADGTVLGEGIGIVVLKRREDAERDRDRIYALVKGAGVSSDGKGAGLLAPRREGAALALRRAYEDAGLDPRTVEMMEAHGTGTRAGDMTEIEALQETFGQRTGRFPPCALGSVKSMIGHLLPAAGSAGLIKATLALYHKVLPPTVGCEEPNPSLDLKTGFFYVNTKARPWIHGSGDYPRRAGVSAFGFGGINAHVILEEYPGDGQDKRPHLLEWHSELILVGAQGRSELTERMERLIEYLGRVPEAELRDLAYTLFRRHGSDPVRLALVVHSREDLVKKLGTSRKRLSDPHRRQIKDRKGIYYFDEPLDPGNRLVFLFPGEGAQYPDMLADLCMLFPSVRECFDRADASFLRHGKPYLPSDAVFPRPAFRDEDKETWERLLWQMDVAVESVLTANQALYRLLTDLGVRPAVLLGHSTGEYSAMLASGILDGISEELVIETNQLLLSAEQEDQVPEAVMLAAGTDRARIEAILEESRAESLFIAMDNCPHQVVLVGPEEQARKVSALLKDHRILCEPLPFRRGYHTPLFKAVTDRLRAVFQRYPISRPRIPVWSCTLKGPYPEDPDRVRGLLEEHWIQPVAFRETIENLYQAGYRLFVEAGPRGNLTAFVEDILRGRPHLAVPSNLPRLPGIDQLHHVLGILAAQGVPVNLLPLYEPRNPRELTLDPVADRTALRRETGESLTLQMGLPQMDLPDAEGLRPPSAPERVRMDPGRREDAPGTARPAGNPGLRPQPLDNGPQGQEDPILASYFRNMEKFLQVQQEVMEAYLERRTPGQAPATDHGRPAEEPPAPDQAALHKPQSTGPSPTAASCTDPPPRRVETGDPGDVSRRILRLVSEKTGYPEEMLNLDLDMEAELGIDSIKRVEILTAYQLEYAQDQELDMEQASRQKTLGSLIAFLQQGASPLALGPEACPGPSPGTGQPGHKDLPLCGEILSHGPGEVRCRRTFDFSSDPYLEDHVLSGPISILDPERRGLAVVPLTVSMEMMIEVASLVVPDRLPVRMHEIRAHRWIPVADQGFTVEIEARRVGRKGEDEVEVKVWESLPASGHDGPPNAPLMTAVVGFADQYPSAPDPEASPLENEGPSRWDTHPIYPEGMFHGPRFQAVRSVDRCAENGATATLEVLPFDRFFDGDPRPRLFTDPVVLDAAGQLVGLWTAERLDRGFVVFPYRCQHLSLFGPLHEPGTRITARARIELFGHNQVRSDIDLVGPDGMVWMRLEGWEDKRFDLPEAFHRFWKHPVRERLSHVWTPPIQPADPPGPSAGCTLEDPLEGADGIWKTVWVHAVLGPEERKAYRALKGNEKRKTEWLLGRTAAKDALRSLIEDQLGIRLGPADIEVSPAGSNRPVFGGPWQHESNLKGLRPVLSIAHSNRRALACVLIAREEEYSIGVDLEPLPPPEGTWERLAFSDGETRLLEQRDPAERDEWKLRFWCAKEALSKALGTGLDKGPRTVEVLGWGPANGTLLARPRQGNGKEPPQPTEVHTVRDRDWIIAWTWIRARGNGG